MSYIAIGSQGSYNQGKSGKCQGICVVRESQGNDSENIIVKKSGKMTGSCRVQITVIFCISKY